MTLRGFRRRLDKIEQQINVRDGKPIPVTDEAYVEKNTRTPYFVVNRVSFGCHNAQTIGATTRNLLHEMWDDQEVEFPALGVLADAEPGDVIELSLVKKKNRDES